MLSSTVPCPPRNLDQIDAGPLSVTLDWETPQEPTDFDSYQLKYIDGGEEVLIDIPSDRNMWVVEVMSTFWAIGSIRRWPFWNYWSRPRISGLKDLLQSPQSLRCIGQSNMTAFLFQTFQTSLRANLFKPHLFFMNTYCEYCHVIENPILKIVLLVTISGNSILILYTRHF